MGSQRQKYKKLGGHGSNIEKLLEHLRPNSKTLCRISSSQNGLDGH